MGDACRHVHSNLLHGWQHDNNTKVIDQAMHQACSNFFNDREQHTTLH